MIADWNREARERRVTGFQSPGPVHGRGLSLGREVVHRDAQRGGDGPRLRECRPELVLDRFDIFAALACEQRRGAFQRLNGVARSLAVVHIGGRFAQPVFPVVVGQTHEHVDVLGVGASRYDERIAGVEREDLMLHAH